MRHPVFSARPVLAALVLLLSPAGALRAETEPPPPLVPHSGPASDLRHGDLRVAPNRRYLVHADGTPFLWIGDTAWELFHRLTREEVATYLDKRRAQGFTVIQTVALSEFDGLHTPNAYGHLPLEQDDPARPAVKPGPADDYWDHVSFVVEAARQRGLWVALLPTWADKVLPARSGPRTIFTEANARAYGRWLGARYAASPNLIWVLGGDRPAIGLPADGAKDVRPVWRALAAGIKEKDRRHLLTFHPWRPDSSSRWFHDDAWLDFNMLQSGHGAKDWPNWARIAGDYHMNPPKPTLDGEPRYEAHAVSHELERGVFDEYDVRQAAYWAVFAGAFGHTYGAHEVWQFWAPPRPPIGAPGSVKRPWSEALDLPGAWDLLHLRRLLLSRPFLTRIPDPSVVPAGSGAGADHVEVSRDQAGRFAFIYIPTGKSVTVDLRRIHGDRVKVWWFDPRTGRAIEGPVVEPKERPDFLRDFDPPGDYPGRGSDWVLVLDEASQGYGPPGAPSSR